MLAFGSRAPLLGFVLIAVLGAVSECYGQADKHSGLYLIFSEGRSGYMDRTGRVVIEPRFEFAQDFSEGLAVVGFEGKFGYIDTTGKVAIPPTFDFASDFSEGLAAVKVGSAWGFVDKTGAMAIPARFEKASGFSDGLALVTASDSGEATGPADAGASGYIDRKGDFVISPRFHWASGDFVEGVAFVSFPDSHDPPAAFVDKSGRVIAPADRMFAGNFSEGLAPSMKDGKWGFIDPTGKFVIPPRFENVQSFTEGLAPVQIGGKRGYIDKHGTLVIPAKFDAQFNFFPENQFREGLAPVDLGDGYQGYIDKTGKVVLRIRASEVHSFSGGLARVFTDKGIGFIDRQGHFVWGPTVPHVGGATPPNRDR
jgi:hypothetical protein